MLLRGCGGDPRDSRCGASRPPEVLDHAEKWERDSEPPRGARASPKASAGESVMGSIALYLSPAIGGVSVFVCEGDVCAPDEGSVVSAGALGQGLPLIVYGPSIAWMVGEG